MDTAPEFHEHSDHVEFQYEAIPGPSDEKLLKSKNYKKDPSIEPSEVIYMIYKKSNFRKLITNFNYDSH